VRGREEGRVINAWTRIDVIAGRCNPYEDFQSYLTAAVNPDVRIIISNTTEAGIVFKDSDRAEDQPAASFPAKLTQLLRVRYLALGGGKASALFIMPCELIEKNGQTLREYVLAHARRWFRDTAFEQWIAEDCTFVDTLVDRIVPGHDTEARAKLLAETHFDDGLLTVAEPYYILAIQGAERENLLPFRKAGLNVVWTDDISPYRLLKVRILNGGHTFLAMVGAAMGVTHVRACLEHPLLRPALECLYAREIVPALPLPLEEGEVYARTILDRFDNPFMEHKLESIAFNTVSKWRARLLPSLLDYHAKKSHIPPLIALSMAALIHRYTTVEDIQDETAVLAGFARLKSLAAGDPAQLVQAVLADASIWGGALPDLPGFIEEVTTAYQEIRSFGMQAALERAMTMEVAS
jgi:tagaturonate reductase